MIFLNAVLSCVLELLQVDSFYLTYNLLRWLQMTSQTGDAASMEVSNQMNLSLIMAGHTFLTASLLVLTILKMILIME